MGRTTILVFASSASISECVNDEHSNTINAHKMNYWDIIGDELFPSGCKKHGDEYYFGKSEEKPMSSKGYKNKFNGYFYDNFDLVSEGAMNELVTFLKKFDNYTFMFVIDDSMSGGELVYTIRGYTKNKKVMINIEITDMCDDELKTTTVCLNYDD